MWLKFFTSKGGVKMNVNERYLIGIIILLSATAVVFDKHTVSLWLLMISFIVCLNKLICEISEIRVGFFCHELPRIIHEFQPRIIIN